MCYLYSYHLLFREARTVRKRFYTLKKMLELSRGSRFKYLLGIAKEKKSNNNNNKLKPSEVPKKK
jgi:hypothetical protein